MVLRIDLEHYDGFLQLCDRKHFSPWDKRVREIADIGAPILESPSFQRLAYITFLGILSPRFANIISSPFFSKRKQPLLCDGSRQSHSLGVALIALDMVRFLDFSPLVQRYAVAWGLLHDIGNWPLSHTGEYAFSRITNTSTCDLRRGMITGESGIPRSLNLSRAVAAMKLNKKQLIALLEHRSEGLAAELHNLATLINSPLNPDVLEGMWRCGIIFRVDVPPPSKLTRSFLQSLFNDISLHKAFAKEAFTFWRKKAAIYRRFINRSRVIAWESAWSRAILRDFSDISLKDSLYLSENNIVQTILTRGLPKDVPMARYKHPLEYIVNPPYKRSLSNDEPLSCLAKIFAKRRLEIKEKKPK